MYAFPRIDMPAKAVKAAKAAKKPADAFYAFKLLEDTGESWTNTHLTFLRVFITIILRRYSIYLWSAQCLLLRVPYFISSPSPVIWSSPTFIALHLLSYSKLSSAHTMTKKKNWRWIRLFFFCFRSYKVRFFSRHRIALRDTLICPEINNWFLFCAGICIVPGSGFGQKPGTYHFRTTILPQPEMLKGMLETFKTFHEKFTKEFS